MDEGIAQVRKDVLPLFVETEGFRGIIGLVDRNSNSGITISLWDDEESMDRSEDVGVELRRKAAEAMKAETEPMVNRYEIVLYQVPEPVTTEVG
jgi:heme-degrading monooxygenase HmoA